MTRPKKNHLHAIDLNTIILKLKQTTTEVHD